MRFFYLAAFIVALVGLGFLALRWRAYREQEAMLKRVNTLIQQFGARDVQRRDAARKELLKIGSPAIPALVETLAHKRELVRQGALETLEAIGSPAIEPLILAMRDPEFKGRGFAVNALGRIAKKTKSLRAIRALISILEDDRSKEQHVDTNAALMLTQIGKPAVKPLIAALAYRNPTIPFDPRNRRIRSWAATILGTLGDRRAADASGKSPTGVDDADRRLIAAALQKALRDEQEAIRSNAARGLGLMHDPRNLPILLEALNDPQPNVRKAVVEAIGDTGDPAAERILWQRASDLNEDEQVRLAAQQAILNMKLQRQNEEPIPKNSPD
ncbi:MAG: HEAT repeat domain-containing protein [Abditibacteriales bacterium]|nr:HEAT repeat domain-containing protein [Abditibacteriales bacterium]MDW8367443.1 HEAT repeat domain-containing protein [Abditibacteriales bacterium]